MRTEIDPRHGDAGRRDQRQQQPDQADPWRFLAAGEQAEHEEEGEGGGAVPAGHAEGAERVGDHLGAGAFEQLLQGIGQQGGAEHAGGGEQGVAPQAQGRQQ
ncbi:hypothetical protein D9M71_332460 [compost metagenome]